LVVKEIYFSMDNNRLQIREREPFGLNKPIIRTWLHRAGTFVGLLGIMFVALRFYSYAGELHRHYLAPGVFFAAAALALVYGAANLLLAFAWHFLLRRLSVRTSVRWAVWAYAVSQLAKYVPGNIFQFAGRQAIGAAAGLQNWPLAKSAALELTMISTIGFMFMPLVTPLLWSSVDRALSVGAFILCGLLVLVLARRLAGGEVARAASCYYAFLLISGGIFVIVLALAGGSVAAIGIPALAGAFVLAWLAGLLTPGAPAGLGIREAVLLYLLHGAGNASTVLVAVLLGRVVTVSGDFLFYAIGRMLVKRTTEETKL
jgi:hypothetical protein